MSTETLAPQSTTSVTSSTPSSSSTPSGSSRSGSVQLKKAVSGKPLDVQLSMLSPVQRHGGGGPSNEDVHAAAATGIASGGGPLPHADKIQQSFGGHDISAVQAHTGAAAQSANQAMGAEAYATGNHIAFGSSPDLHTVAHEAAHVVQQQHGVSLSGGVGQSGDAYENHADKVADAVVSGKSAEPILNEMTGGAPAGGAIQQRSIQQRAVQREETPAAPSPEGASNTQAPPPVDPATAKQAAFDAAKATALGQADAATDPGSIRGMLSGLPASATDQASGLSTTFATDQGLAGTMIGKLETAFTQARAAWAAADAANAAQGKPAMAPQKENDFITSRLNILKTSGPAGIKKTLNSATVAKPVSIKDCFWNICAANWDMCAPEEEASGELLDRIGGVYKAFDAGDFWTKMDPALQGAWAAHGGQAAWMALLTNGAKVPVAPTGKEADPDFADYTSGRKVAFPGTISGFISTANAMKNAQIISADKKGVLDLLALQPGRYTSPKMFLAAMGSAGAGASRAATAGQAKAARLGKPSMFYLIAFPENVYVAENREHGETAGDEPELQTTNMPAQAFLDGPVMVKS